VRIRPEVAIAVHGRLNRGVPELSLHLREVLAVVDEQRRERVVQIVNPHVCEPIPSVGLL
jgi:hypothetical protein